MSAAAAKNPTRNGDDMTEATSAAVDGVDESSGEAVDSSSEDIVDE